MGESAVRLNLGCGGKILAGYINCDFEDNHSGIKPDVVCDVRKLPFEDEYADEILAVHLVEHFYPWEAEEILGDWKRVLKPGGRLVLELPCLEKIIAAFMESPISIRKTWWGLYGDPRYRNPHMVHKWAYSVPMIKELVGSIGFQDVKAKEAQFHLKQRDMRIEAVKEK
jgi:predicted SAM-dependent methyltransferase